MDRRRREAEEEEEERGLVWKLPVVKSKQLGRMGPAFGFGTGCGVGFGLGLMGGLGLGPGIPGLQLGFGVGAGCGVGLGFGYGVGRGIAYDEVRRYSNIGNLNLFSSSPALPTQYCWALAIRIQINSIKHWKFDPLSSNTNFLH